MEASKGTEGVDCGKVELHCYKKKKFPVGVLNDTVTLDVNHKQVLLPATSLEKFSLWGCLSEGEVAALPAEKQRHGRRARHRA